MNWPEFFKHKKRARLLGIGGGIFTAFTAMQLSTFYFIFHRKFDPTITVMGMDQSVFYFGGIAASTMGGYVVGSILLPLVYKHRLVGFRAKELKFTHRINKYRPKDLTMVGAGDNLKSLDYYGERVFSLNGYRQWLKRQQKFKLTGKLPHRLLNWFSFCPFIFLSCYYLVCTLDSWLSCLSFIILFVPFLVYLVCTLSSLYPR